MPPDELRAAVTAAQEMLGDFDGVTSASLAKAAWDRLQAGPSTPTPVSIEDAEASVPEPVKVKVDADHFRGEASKAKGRQKRASDPPAQAVQADELAPKRTRVKTDGVLIRMEPSTVHSADGVCCVHVYGRYPST